MSTKTHTVSCRSYHPAARPWQQYVGAIAWESITDVSCDPADLTDPLARFLAENAPAFCASGRPHSDHTQRIRCFNGLTEADMMRRERPSDAESYIRAYDMESRASLIDDFRLPQAEAGDDGLSYWARAAEQIRAAGTEMVQIGDAVFFV
ncbi:MAG: hypothetical protein MZV65_28515 [Chromatiales bacterium]|nr:hypothetical protein [Chromatiales bacterium]